MRVLVVVDLLVVLVHLGVDVVVAGFKWMLVIEPLGATIRIRSDEKLGPNGSVPLLQGGRCVDNVDTGERVDHNVEDLDVDGDGRCVENVGTGETVDHNVEGLDVDGGAVVKVIREGWKVEKVVPDGVNSGELETVNPLVSGLKVESVDVLVEISGRIVEVGNCGIESSLFAVENMDSILDISGRKVEKVYWGVEISGGKVDRVVCGDTNPCSGPVG